nr:uncharacterized protein LOC109401331 [Aedes albopictus]
MNCVCKREFKTRSEAEAEMDRMENKSDTENEETHVMLPPKKKLRNDPPSKSHKTFEPRDFNALITSAAMDLQETEAGTNQDQVVPLDSSIGDQQIIFVEPQCTITEEQMTDSSQLIYLNTNSATSGATDRICRVASRNC